MGMTNWEKKEMDLMKGKTKKKIPKGKGSYNKQEKRAKKKKSFFSNNKGLLILGVAGAGFLLLSQPASAIEGGGVGQGGNLIPYVPSLNPDYSEAFTKKQMLQIHYLMLFFIFLRKLLLWMTPLPLLMMQELNPEAKRGTVSQWEN